MYGMITILSQKVNWILGLFVIFASKKQQAVFLLLLFNGFLSIFTLCFVRYPPAMGSDSLIIF